MMTDSCWFPQVIRGEYVLNTVFGLERVWNGYGTGMECTPIATSICRYCFRWFRMEGSGIWIGMCVYPCSGPIILSGSHMGFGIHLDDNPANCLEE